MRSPFCACSTGNGKSAIAVIRISGNDITRMLSSCFRIIRSAGRFHTLKDLPGYTAAYADFLNPLDDHRIVDKVIVTHFEAPYSYTGQEMLEISCHGGTAVRNEILEVLYEQGIRPADPGEFTKTALFNGKLGLAEVEGVMSVINAESKRALRAADTCLLGELGRKLEEQEKILYRVLALIEMIVEFPEHEDTKENHDELLLMLNNVTSELKKLENSYKQGRLLRDTLRVAFLGKPNSGKSTALNLVAGYQRAIVTDVAGTTRDTLEFTTEIGGIPVTFIDTAGIRSTEDKIEAIGVERALDASKHADLTFFLISPADSLQEIIEAMEDIKEETVVLFSKSDKGENPCKKELTKLFKSKGVTRFHSFSSLKNSSKKIIDKEIVSFFEALGEDASSNITIMSERHRATLNKAIDLLEGSMDTLENGLGVDLTSAMARNALETIGEITGKTCSVELVNQIFSDFCIGK